MSRLELVCRGGFPAIVTMSPVDRLVWFESYATTVISRDIIAHGRPPLFAAHRLAVVAGGMMQFDAFPSMAASQKY